MVFKKSMIMKGLLLLLLYMNLSQANLLCSTDKMTWYDAIKSCLLVNGRPMTSTSPNANLIKFLPSDDMSIWSVHYTETRSSDISCRPGAITLMKMCGFINVHVNKNTYIYGEETKYGSCYVHRLYVCKEESGKYTSSLGVFYTANKCRIYPGEDFEYALRSGNYWTNRSSYVCIKSYDINGGFSVPEVSFNDLCEAYDTSDGFYFANCSSKRYIICQLNIGTELPEGYRECFNGDQSKTSPKPSTITSLHSAFTTHSSTSTTSETGDTSIPNILDTNGKQPDQQSGNDLGVKVGVPVAVCIVLLIVVTIVIIGCRRYRSKQKTTTENSYVDGKLKSKSDNKQTPTRYNPTYNVPNVDKMRGRAKSDNSGNNVADDTYDNTLDVSEETVYDSVNDVKVDDEQNSDSHGENNRSVKKTPCSQYSGIRGRGEDEMYDTTRDRRQIYKTSDDYDTLQSDDINYESGKYDTTNQRHPNHSCIDDYDHLNNVTTESDYDTTRPVGQVAVTTDNTYNRLDCVDGSKK